MFGFNRSDANSDDRQSVCFSVIKQLAMALGYRSNDKQTQERFVQGDNSTF